MLWNCFRRTEKRESKEGNCRDKKARALLKIQIDEGIFLGYGVGGSKKKFLDRKRKRSSL